MKIGIVAIGYNRPDAMARLLHSLDKANYCEDKVDLIISLDKGARQQENVDLAYNFVWNCGEKIVHIHKERLGLRAHVLWCGDLTQKYDAIIALEDDVSVSEGFYTYTKQAVEFYGKNSNIAGISLYRHSRHHLSRRPFEPTQNGFDAFFMQFAKSWGQCWTTSMWAGFRKWYDANCDKPLAAPGFPDAIASWDERSWLKYYMKYVFEKNKFFVYPYVSLSTNNSDDGEHNVGTNSDYQVPLLQGCKNYIFPNFEQGVFYDIFSERMNINVPGFDDKRVCIDLYGIKKNFADYDVLISTVPRPFKVLRTIGLKYRPHEINLFSLPEGEEILVYDLHTSGKEPRYQKFQILRYDAKANFAWTVAIKDGISCMFYKLTKRK